MKAKTKKLLVLFLALALTVVGTVMAVAATIPSKDDFKVIVDTDKDSYEDGEKVNLSIKIENSAEDAEITKVLLSYDISETLQSKIVDYDKLPTSINSLDSGVTSVFSTISGEGGGNGGNGNPNTGVADTVVFFVGIMLVAAGVVLAVRSGYFKKLASLFMVAAMVISLNGISNLTAYASYPASTATYDITGSKTVKYAGQDCKITVKAAITIDADVATEATDSKVDVTNRVSVHDPSIVKEGDTYYIFGSHLAWAKSKDLVNWTTFTNNINRDFATIFAAEATWAAKADSSYKVDGNLWAPDVIWNEEMGKWCMYMSINGPKWNSTISLLTADHLDGNWTYVGPVIQSGMSNGFGVTFDYTKVTGETTVADRYTLRNGNPQWEPHAIDPCVIYDENGDLWMSYGSWSGGIGMFRLDNKTGLRDYNTTYQLNYGTTDPYFGYKIAGGNQQSGEASYIQKIGDYYYLFLSYGGLVANGGYSMRIFRSETVNGPYVDMTGDDARVAYTSVNGDVQPGSAAGNINGKVGIKLMTYYKWSYAKYGQVAQGHNSAFTDNDGKSYVVYHTRTNDGTEGHQVRVHQLFTNKDGWLVAAPYEYRGEAISKTGYTAEQMAGTYEVLYHKQSIDYANLECVTSTELTLNSDGTVSGDYTGTWSAEANSPYVTMTLGGVEYNGVFVEQYIEGTDYKTLCFTILGDNEVEVWGSKYLSGKDAVDFTLANDIVAVPSLALNDITFTTKGLYGTTVSYKSSNESVISNDGKVTMASEEKTVTITAKFVNGDYSIEKDYTVKVPSGTETRRLLAEYYTDGTSFNIATDTPVAFDNPFNKNVTAGIDVFSGISIEFDVKGTGTALSNIIAFTAGDSSAYSGRLYFTGGSYFGYNATGGYFDANLENYALVTDYINGEATIKIVIDDCGFEVYSNDVLAYTSDELKAGTLKGAYTITNYCNVLKWLNEDADKIRLGTGNWWTDKFNGTISNIRLYAEAPEVVDTTGYAYYDDFNKADITGWTSANAQNDLVTSNDGDAHRSYFTFKTDTSVARNPGAYKILDSAITGDMTLEFDTKLTAGDVVNRSEAAVIFGSSDLTSYTGNSVATGGYIVKLYNNFTNNGSTTWVVNDTAEVTIESDKWVHVKAVVNSANNEVEITITNAATNATIYSGTLATSGAGDLKILQLVRGRGPGNINLDNITVVNN